MARRAFDVIDVVEVLEHWHAGRPKLVIAASLDLTMNGYRAKVKRLREVYGHSTEAAEGEEPRTLLERVYAFFDLAAASAPASVQRNTGASPPRSDAGIISASSPAAAARPGLTQTISPVRMRGGMAPRGA